MVLTRLNPEVCVRLVASIQKGDWAAEADFVARFSRGLLQMLRRLTGNPALADDLHQETLALVLKKIRRGELRNPEKLPGFIRSTARNLLIADRRKAARYSQLPVDESETLSAFSTAATVMDQITMIEQARQVRHTLARLRFDRDRQLLFRFYLREEGKNKICSDLNIEPEKFNLLLHRARQRMRELWRKESPLPFSSSNCKPCCDLSQHSRGEER